MKKITVLVCALVVSNVAFSAESTLEEKPILISCALPVMPAKAQALKIDGSVHYSVWVNEKGGVYSVDTTGDEIFFQATQDALRNCKYEPGHSGVDRGTMKFRSSIP
ncbi:energy transducer TonB [Klebsiella michiganensis]|uniref:energy transducer TonB n=1 Tax=Klebsiella michiganensis TaxID=1134687 RepID=UPI003D8135A7